MADFGTDIDVLTDMLPNVALASGRRNLGNAIARRLSTPRGGLAYAPDYGFDLQALINAPATDATASTVQALVMAECEKDERVDSANVYVEMNAPTHEMKLTIDLVTAEGIFRMVLKVSALTVEVMAAA